MIAETLLEKETITAEEIESLVKTGKLPTKVVAEVQETDAISEEAKEKLNKIVSSPTKRDIEQPSTPTSEEKPSETKTEDKKEDK